MIDILINHYREPPEIIGRLLQSIQEQRDVDFKKDIKVYIASDGLENTLSKEFLESFSYPITYLEHSHRGVCATRNSLFDNSSSDYVMFCDADDCFHDHDGLFCLLQCIREMEPDIISSTYLAEVLQNGVLKSVKMRRDVLRLHGKAFKRSFLQDHSIYFPNEMETTGDMFFLWLAFHLTKNVQWLPDYFYTWKWNNGSVTRSCEHYSEKNYPRMVKCYSLLTEYLIELDFFKLLENLVSSCILTFYLDWYSSRWNSVPEEYYESAKVAICSYVKDYAPYCEAVPERYLRNKFRSLLLMKGVEPPVSAFDGLQIWLNEIRSS